MWFFTHVWIVPALMALSFLLILLFGKKMPKKGAEIGIFMVAVCLLFALATAWNWATWNHDAPEVSPHDSEEQALAVEAGALSNVPSECSKLAEEARGHGGGAGAAEGHDTGSGSHGEEGAAATGTGVGETASPAVATSGALRVPEQRLVARAARPNTPASARGDARPTGAPLDVGALREARRTVALGVRCSLRRKHG